MKGSMSLSDAELLSIIIGSGIAGENSLDIARNMLSRCGNSLNELWKCSASDLQRIKGVGKKQALKICAMFAISRRKSEAEIIRKTQISSSREAYQVLQPVIADLPYARNFGYCCSIVLTNSLKRLAYLKEASAVRQWIPKKYFTYAWNIMLRG